MASNRAIADGQRIGAYRKRCQTHNPKLNKRKNRDSNTLEFMGILPEGTPSKSLRRESINQQKKDDSFVKLRASICYEINGFLSYNDGWDGEGSCKPKLGIVKDAIKFIENWSFKSAIPELEPELVFHGTVSLVFYDKERDSRGSIEFQDNRLGIYAVRNQDDKFETGIFDSRSITDIKKITKNVERILSYGVSNK